jgi:hypothetical protein
VVLGKSQPLQGRQAHPDEGFFLVATHALALLVEQGQVELGVGIAARSRVPIPGENAAVGSGMAVVHDGPLRRVCLKLSQSGGRAFDPAQS